MQILQKFHDVYADVSVLVSFFFRISIRMS